MKKGAQKISNWIINILLALFAGICIFPLYWNLTAAFKPVEDIFAYPPPIIPKRITLENFRRLRAYFPYFPRNITNSLILAAGIPLLSVLFNSMAGFAFAKMQFFGKKILFACVIATILIPSTSGYIPLFIEMSKFRLVDNYMAIILPGMAGAFGVFLFRQSLFSVPDALLDAARIDGAGSFKIYSGIALPLIKPMLITIYISSFIGVWNDYFWPFLILKTEEKLTFPVALAGIQGQIFEVPWGIIMMGSLILMLPTIIIYAVLSKYIVPDIFGGGIKA
jgi:multiple sugar transport system permease protein